MTTTVITNVAANERIRSIDQFRGYAVVGMILIGFVGPMMVSPSLFKHNNVYLSYADTIIVTFLLIVGMSFRLTMLHRLQRMSRLDTYLSYVRRSLILIFISILIFGATWNRHSWAQWVEEWRVLLAGFLKSNLWETFAIVGVTQIIILPLVPISFERRCLALFVFAFSHAAFCYFFIWGFVWGIPGNWMVQLWGTGKDSSWDGGCFGPFCWAVPMLAGTLAYDIVASDKSYGMVISRLIYFGLALSLLGYCFSCPTRLYDVGDGQFAPQPDPDDIGRADSPFIPSLDSIGHRSLLSLLAEPPFIPPPPVSKRLQNYWMMSKRIPTLSFILCSTGITLVFYAGFVWLCDVLQWQLGIFRTFGTNPLLAYCISELLLPRIRSFLPAHAPLWYCLAGFAIHFGTIYACVLYFERQKIFVRL